MAGRAEASPSLVAISFALLLFLSFSSVGASHQEQAQKTWCVAKPSTDEATLWENLNYACSQVDCNILKNNGACFNPDILMSHASVAMNLYYQAKGRNIRNCCFKNSAVIVTTDPSSGDCTYAYY